MQEWLTAAEVAELIRVRPETVKRWLRAGELRGSILSDSAGWRVKRSEVERFMKEKETGGPGEAGTDPS